MYLFVLLCVTTALPLRVSRNHRPFFVLTHRTREVAIAAKLATPKPLLHARTATKDLARCQTLDRSHHLRHALRSNALHQKMHMISVRSNLYKFDLVALLNLKARLAQNRINGIPPHQGHQLFQVTQYE